MREKSNKAVNSDAFFVRVAHYKCAGLRLALAFQMKRFVLIAAIFVAGCSHLSGYEPWVTDEFFFHMEGEKREYTFMPVPLSRPEVVLYGKSCVLPFSLTEGQSNGETRGWFKWKIMVEVIQGGETIDRSYLDPKAGWAADGSLECMKAVSFGNLKSIGGELFPSETTVRLIVEKIDPRFSEANESLTIGIRNSPVP